MCMCVCVCVCVYVYVCACVHVYTCTYVPVCGVDIMLKITSLSSSRNQLLVHLLSANAIGIVLTSLPPSFSTSSCSPRIGVQTSL